MKLKDVIQEVCAFTYYIEMDETLRMLEKLHEKILAKDSKLRGFTIRGHIYMMAGFKKDAPTIELPRELHGEFNAYFSRMDKITNDFVRLQKGLYVLLRNLTELQDVRNALPDVVSVGNRDSMMFSLPRTKETSYYHPPGSTKEALFLSIERVMAVEYTRRMLV